MSQYLHAAAVFSFVSSSYFCSFAITGVKHTATWQLRFHRHHFICHFPIYYKCHVCAVVVASLLAAQTIASHTTARNIFVFECLLLPPVEIGGSFHRISHSYFWARTEISNYCGCDSWRCWNEIFVIPLPDRRSKQFSSRPLLALGIKREEFPFTFVCLAS